MKGNFLLWTPDYKFMGLHDADDYDHYRRKGYIIISEKEVLAPKSPNSCYAMALKWIKDTLGREGWAQHEIDRFVEEIEKRLT